MKFRLFKKPVEIGDFVMWEISGTIIWTETKRIVHIEENYAFFDGSLTGIPVGQLIREKIRK